MMKKCLFLAVVIFFFFSLLAVMAKQEVKVRPTAREKAGCCPQIGGYAFMPPFKSTAGEKRWKIFPRCATQEKVEIIELCGKKVIHVRVQNKCALSGYLNAHMTVFYDNNCKKFQVQRRGTRYLPHNDLYSFFFQYPHGAKKIEIKIFRDAVKVRQYDDIQKLK